jgi:hypothetical protein
MSRVPEILRAIVARADGDMLVALLARLVMPWVAPAEVGRCDRLAHWLTVIEWESAEGAQAAEISLTASRCQAVEDHAHGTRARRRMLTQTA